jgi:hypothetical protein
MLQHVEGHDDIEEPVSEGRLFRTTPDKLRSLQVTAGIIEKLLFRIQPIGLRVRKPSLHATEQVPRPATDVQQPEPRILLQAATASQLATPDAIGNPRFQYAKAV